jgi:hypothetical protein
MHSWFCPLRQSGSHLRLGEVPPNFDMCRNTYHFAQSLGSHFESQPGTANVDHET